MFYSRTEMMIKSNSNDVMPHQKNEKSETRIFDKHNNKENNCNTQLSERHYGYCGGICKNHIAGKPSSGDRYLNGQVRCTNCMVFLDESGVVIRNGSKYCKCCNYRVRTRPRNSALKEQYFQRVQSKWIASPTEEQNIPKEITEDNINESEVKVEESIKRSTSFHYEEENNKKAFYELKEFIEDKIQLKANYQLVMLKYLVSHKTANKGEIAESIAYYNNIDTSNIEQVKKFFNVPVYDVLVKRSFVNQTIKYGKKEFELNVKLNEYQQYEMIDLLEKKIEEWNDTNGIPENQFESIGIDWYENENLLIESSYWIWSVSQENWEILKSKNTWASKIPRRQIQIRVMPGDFIIFYVKGTKSFKGIFRVDGKWYDWFNDSGNWSWHEEETEQKMVYESAVKIKPIVLGIAMLDELENLSIFEGKNQDLRNLVLKGGGGYPSNTGKPIPSDDFLIIKQLLERNPLLVLTKGTESEDKIQEPILSKSDAYQPDNEISKIQFDGSSYFIALPNKWISNNGSKQGDPLAISRLESSLLQIKPMWLKEFHDEQGLQTENTTLEIKPDDDVRKIQFDGSSYFIALPNKWITDMNLQQDDSVLVLPKSKTILEISLTNNKSKTITDESSSTISGEEIEKIDITDRRTFENNSEGIIINEMKILKQEVIKLGQIITNGELTQKFGVGNMGGIRYSSKNNLIVLCDTQSSHYNDRIDPDTGIIVYTGEGQVGDQELKGGNFRISNSSNLSLFYFVEVPQEPGMKKRGVLDNIYKFVGKVKYLKHSFKVENDSSGNPRVVIKFLLEIEK